MHTNTRFAVAIHILTLLAFRDDAPLTSEMIAHSVTTNPVVIRRTLAHLRKAGLVVSQAGNRGGWRLKRLPEQITLLDVYRAIEQGRPFAFPTQEPNPECCIGNTIKQALGEFFVEAEAAMEAALAQITIAAALERIENLNPLVKREKSP